MKRFLITVTVLASFAQATSAEIVNVADHGIAPGKDVTVEVNRLIASLTGQGDVTLFFPEGRYEFYPENAVEAHRAVTNHDNGLKRMAMPLFGLDGFTVDGGGSTFMFHGRISPIVVDDCRKTTLKNFCDDVTVEDNQFLGFEWPIRIESSPDTKNLTVKNNKGLSF